MTVLFVVMFYKVDVNIQLVNTESLFLGKIQGLDSCEPLVTTFRQTIKT